MGVWGLATRKILRIGLLEIECESDFSIGFHRLIWILWGLGPGKF